MPKGEKERRMGSIKRNIICGCGWSCSSSPDRIYKIIQLHSKRCSFIDIETFKNLPNTSLHNNKYHQDTPKNTNIEALCFKDGVSTNINLTKRKIVEQVVDKLNVLHTE